MSPIIVARDDAPPINRPLRVFSGDKKSGVSSDRPGMVSEPNTKVTF